MRAWSLRSIFSKSGCDRSLTHSHGLFRQPPAICIHWLFSLRLCVVCLFHLLRSSSSGLVSPPLPPLLSPSPAVSPHAVQLQPSPVAPLPAVTIPPPLEIAISCMRGGFTLSRLMPRGSPPIHRENCVVDRTGALPAARISETPSPLLGV